MLADDNDDEEPTTGAVRYPVMPSLVALQQMRNRLHMGELGRKLMKWTSIATGQELRKISAELQTLYTNFQEEVKQAFIMLARSRYFFPNLNKMVVEDLQFGASLTVATTARMVTGVRIFEYHIIENKTSYDYLGLGQGGETIYEAKQCWIDLLKLEIKMAELRSNYVQIEAAHKSATKRLNIINKIVLPKTKTTIKYIILELEESAREGLYRIKKVKECKKKKADKKDKGEIKKMKVCPICTQSVDHSGDVCDKVEEEQMKVKSQLSPVKTSPETKEIVKSSQSISFAPPELKCPHKTPSSYIDRPSELVAVHEPLHESKRDLFKPWCCMDKPCSETSGPAAHISLGEKIGSGSKLQQLKKMLSDAINLGESVAETEGETAEMNEFLKLCKDAQDKLDLAGGREVLGDTTSLIAANLEHLKVHIQDVINVTRELRKITFLSPSIENFVHSCENVDEKLKLAIKDVQVAPADQTAKDKFQKLGTEIDDIMQVIKNYKEEGLLKEGVEEFSKICDITKSKLDSYGKSPADEKLDHLKSHIAKLEEISTEIKRDGVRSASIEKFLSSCKDFKIKLEKQKEDKSCAAKCEHVTRLIEQIDDAVKSAKEAKQEGVITESVENFIRSCETFKSRIGSKNTQSFERSQVQKLQSDIQSVMQLIDNLHNQGLITVSMADFLRSCEKAKHKLDLDEDEPLCQESNVILSPKCGELCTCESDEDHDKCKLCDNCQNVYDEDQDSDSDDDNDTPSPSCDTCQDGEPVDRVKLNTPCDSCLKADLEETDCDDCGECGPPPPPVEAEDTAGGLGLFEKKVRTITKITRYRTPTGDIREEKEVTTIKKTKHDPDETNIDHDDESDDSFEVGLCLTPNLNQIGFQKLARRSKSEQLLRVSSLNNPRFKQSISFNPQVLFMKNPSQLMLFLADTEETLSTISLCLYPKITL